MPALDHVELLAPAGGMEQLQAAIRFGADAVYLAADKFGMRARACNFPVDSLAQAVDIAHAAGVKVYVTCNILMHDSDLTELPPYLEAVARAGVDALIVSDLGALRLARRYAPGLALHVSTQASVANAEAAMAWYEMGARRVVVAREMSLADIARMKSALPPDMEIEAFVHGAMCMAVSGRCLISAYLTGRSGNKGHCTQPCRWNYTLEEEKRPGDHFPVEEDGRGSFIMNAKDLNMIAHVRDVAEAGVTSFKIEGRNKKAFYVAAVVNAYRQVIDGADPALLAPELETVSHRPYSTGFFFGEPGQSADVEGYTQECLHVADVVACCKAGEAEGPCPGASGASGAYVLTVRCRNRFCEGERLEVLAPGAVGESLVVRNLAWLPDAEAAADAAPAAEAGAAAGFAGSLAPAAEAAAVANRSCALYRFSCDIPVEPGGFLRVRRFRSSRAVLN